MDITNANNDTKEENEVQEAPKTPIESTTKKISQDGINEESQDEINKDMNKKYGERSGIYNLTPRKLPMLPREYGKLHAVLHVEEQLWQMHHTLLAQYWVNKGLRLYKEECAESVLKGLRQLHQKLAIYPNEPTKKTRE